MRLRSLIATTAAACALAPVAPAAAQLGFGPDDIPSGANNWSCQPSPAHPNPVVLVHGLGANMAQNWQTLSPTLASHGYCVFALTYGREPANPYPFDQLGGLKPMEESAQQLSAFIDSVLAATGAAKVDIVGHSEGSLMPNYYVKFLGGAAKVDRYVGLTPLWDGTNLAGAGTLNQLASQYGDPAPLTGQFQGRCSSCPQFISGSPFIKKMNEGGTPRVPGVTYTMIMTRYDQLVIPYWSGFMEGATNIVLQQQCAADTSEHMMVAFDPVVARDVLNALDPASARPPVCPVGPRFGGVA